MRVEMIEHDESDLLKSEACCSVLQRVGVCDVRA